MMAAVRHFIYRGGGQEAIPRDATHVRIHESITVLPRRLCFEHPNIIELICHDGVVKIEEESFECCPCLIRVVILGVKIVEEGAFIGCKALKHVKCRQLERVDFAAFDGCKSLIEINLKSVKFVEKMAFRATALRDVEFSNNLESIETEAFADCPSLERIALPLREEMYMLIRQVDTFYRCDNLQRVDLVEDDVMRKTVAALLRDEWRKDMDRVIDEINFLLPFASAGDRHDVGEKFYVILQWAGRVLRKIIDYKAQHSKILSETASILSHDLPDEIVTNNILSFFELPLYMFDGENKIENEDGSRSHYQHSLLHRLLLNSNLELIT